MIELRNLTVGYPGRAVLSGVDLEFRPGEVLVLVGPNGCGKSTLLKTVPGLLPKLGGDILVDGAPAETLTRRQLAHKIAYLAQSRNVPSITARRMVLHGRFPYLGYPRKYRPEDYAAAEQALRAVDALDLAGQDIQTLSGGQRQRVYLAMALAQDTETILMDEPTTYLDVRHQLEVMETARRLAGQGRAVVLVLHDLCLALRTADRVAVLWDGALRQTGTPEEIFSGGVLDRAFGIRLCRMETSGGWQYYYG
ncbi:MAG: ABC transporter ATP-binding protein [Dysosmobacter sp.]|nr:ABC transporter ATP-binding protein [Dysosmobacter sp.]